MTCTWVGCYDCSNLGLQELRGWSLHATLVSAGWSTHSKCVCCRLLVRTLMTWGNKVGGPLQCYCWRHLGFKDELLLMIIPWIHGRNEWLSIYDILSSTWWFYTLRCAVGSWHWFSLLRSIYVEPAQSQHRLSRALSKALSTLCVPHGVGTGLWRYLARCAAGSWHWFSLPRSIN